VHLTMPARFGAGASEKGWSQYLVGVLCYQNLAKAMKLLLTRCRDEIGSALWGPLTPPHVQRAQQARRGQRLSQYQQIMALSKEGVKDAEIACRTKLSIRMIRR
jgi:hypothetical protein